MMEQLLVAAAISVGTSIVTTLIVCYLNDKFYFPFHRQENESQIIKETPELLINSANLILADTTFKNLSVVKVEVLPPDVDEAGTILKERREYLKLLSDEQARLVIQDTPNLMAVALRNDSGSGIELKYFQIRGFGAISVSETSFGLIHSHHELGLLMEYKELPTQIGFVFRGIRLVYDINADKRGFVQATKMKVWNG